MIKLNKINKVRNIIPKYTSDLGYTNEINKIIKETFNNKITVPTVINEKKYYNNIINKQTSPIDNKKIVCEYNETTYDMFSEFLNNFNNYKKSLLSYSNKDRINTFKKASELLNTKYRDQMLAYTIMGQGKSLYEAEIDAVCELGDFLNYNTYYYQKIIANQPFSPKGIHNESCYNPLNGFVAAITPFNFTAIGGNLASTPTLFSNSVIWKPSDNSILSNFLFYEILLESGMPKEAISFTPSSPYTFSSVILNNSNLGGLLFTGSSDIFSDIYKKIGENIDQYNNFPRIIGETGGKNFHFIHSDLSLDKVKQSAQKTIESAYGYSGQKCSACSVVYVPKVHYDDFVEAFLIARDKFMSLDSFKNYGVIHSRSYNKTKNILHDLKKNSKYNFICGGDCDDSNGKYYIEPTLINCQDIEDLIFKQEFFAPILAIYCYNENETDDAMILCKTNSKYGLTGSVFSEDQNFIDYSKVFFREKCGNFYINDKSTGSVVGQQPFGGSNKSGTNDKAGDINLLYRLFNQQNIKTNYL